MRPGTANPSSATRLDNDADARAPFVKLAEVLAIGTNDRVRAPRQPLTGERRAQVEKIVRDALAVRPELPKFDLAKAA